MRWAAAAALYENSSDATFFIELFNFLRSKPVDVVDGSALATAISFPSSHPHEDGSKSLVVYLKEIKFISHTNDVAFKC